MLRHCLGNVTWPSHDKFWLKSTKGESLLEGLMDFRTNKFTLKKGEYVHPLGCNILTKGAWLSRVNRRTRVNEGWNTLLKGQYYKNKRINHPSEDRFTPNSPYSLIHPSEEGITLREVEKTFLKCAAPLWVNVVILFKGAKGEWGFATYFLAHIFSNVTFFKVAFTKI